MMLGQHNRENRHTAIQLRANHAINYCSRHKVISIDAFIHDQSASDDGIILATPSQQLGLKWNFITTRNIKGINGIEIDTNSPTSEKKSLLNDRQPR